MEQEKELENTFLEEYESAELLLKNKKLKSATILLSKALFALADHIILKKYNTLPKNHKDRFRILEIKEPKIYAIIDGVWSKYTDSYSKPVAEESIRILTKSIKEIAKDESVTQRIKETTED